MALVCWMPLNGDLTQQGTENTTFSGTPAWKTYGKIGSAALNLQNRITCTTTALNGVQFFSVTFWARIENNPDSTANWMDVIGFTDQTSSGTNGQFRFETGYGNSAYSGVHWHDNATNAIINGSYTYNTGTEFDKWHHIAVTVSDTEVCSYYDGILKSTITTNLNKGHLTGAWWLGESTTRGCIQDVRIYDHALSAAEVKEISQGLVLHYKLDTLYPASPTHIDSTINDTAYNSSISKYGYNTTSNLAKTSGVFQGKQCIKVSTITAGQNAQPYAYFSNLFTSNGTNQPAYKRLEFDYYTTCPTTTWLNIYKLGSGTGTASWTTQSSAGTRSGMYTNSESGHNLLVVPNEWNHVSVVFHGDTDANAEWGYCINGPTHVSNANYYFLYANIEVTASSNLAAEDSSGYNHHGTSFGSLISTAETGRYSSSTKLNSSSPTDSTETGITYILSPLALTTPNQMTVAWWAKPESGYSGGTGHAAFCTSVNSRPTDYNATAMHHRDAGFDLCPNSGSSIRLTFNQYTANQWHHYAVTYDGQKATAYKDGVALTNTSMAAASPLKSFNNIWIGYSQAGGVKRKTLGSYSDFRVYVTTLSADDILQLYHTSAKIDNKQNLHSFEFNETSSQKITKSGQVIGQNLLETYIPLYDKNIYTEPDGSTWIHIFHHNNPANSKFNEPTLDWTTGKYLDADRWYDVDQAVYYMLSPYEFMVKQKTTSSAAETKYRWVQTANPLTAVWADVKPGTVTFNTSSGYTSSSHGGMYLLKSSNLHMCIANSSNGNWYGGIGAAAAYQGGIPGYPNTTVTSGYIDLYVRVYNGTKIIKNIGISSSEFIEL